MMNRLADVVLGVATALVISGSALGGTTLINTGGENGGGPGVSYDGKDYELPSVIEGIYAGTGITGNVSTGLTVTGVAGGNITLTRVQDTTAGSASNLLLGGSNYGAAGVTDAEWQNGPPASSVDLTVQAKYASYNQSFGYEVGNGPDVTLLSDANAPGTTADNITIGAGAFQWWRAGDQTSSTSNVWYSNPSNNGGEDHLVTYYVTQNGAPLAGQATWLLCWEDMPFVSSDLDYQDLVVQVVANAVTVPAPAAVWSGLITLAGLGAVRWARRRGGWGRALAGGG